MPCWLGVIRIPAPGTITAVGILTPGSGVLVAAAGGVDVPGVVACAGGVIGMPANGVAADALFAPARRSAAADRDLPDALLGVEPFRPAGLRRDAVRAWGRRALRLAAFLDRFAMMGSRVRVSAVRWR